MAEMNSTMNDPHLGVVERKTEPKRQRRSVKSAFSTAELHRSFERHVARAQHLFLRDDKDGAEREATLALRIHPTDHLFALLAVIAESKGQHDRSSDFRLLQAFLANDPVLWEELLHEFLQEQLYYKSAVCLQRLSVLETKDKNRYRTLQLQLADLYIGLGEIKRAINILVPLWNGSCCRDFEVFALLSSLFFQLGRWNSLHRLIESSLKNAFRPGGATMVTPTEAQPLSAPSNDTGMAVSTMSEGGAVAIPAKRRISKRVRFFGTDNDDDSGNHDGDKNTGFTSQETHRQQYHHLSSGNEETLGRYRNDTSVTAVCSVDPLAAIDVSLEEQDEFDFSNIAKPSGGGSKAVDAAPSTVIHSLYGDVIELRTPRAKKNFLTLVNVHAELLNEEGHFLDTVRLIEFTAGCLEVPLLELPPDLLFRMGVAYAFLGGMEQQCREVFQHLVDTCPMAEYGDVLYDSANALQQVGMHTEARMLFYTLRRYHEFRLSSKRDDGDEDEEETNEVRTVFVAALFAEGQCEASLGNTEVAYSDFCRVLEMDPTHLQTRLALGHLYMYEMKDVERAVAVLTPSENEQPLERIQLGAVLVRVFAQSGKYVEAIALGISIFELVLSGEDDGDTDSVAPGSSRRSTAPLSMPTLSRASSAIIPPSVISDIVNGPRLTSAISSSVGRLSHTLATSIRAASAVFRSNLARRGSAPLTSSVFGASAAASTAAGWSRAEEEGRLKDSSAIFRFHHRKKSLKRLRSTSAKNNDGVEEEKIDGGLAKSRQRVEDVTYRRAESFWKEEEEEENTHVEEDEEGEGVDRKKERKRGIDGEIGENSRDDYRHQVKNEVKYTLGERELADLERELDPVGNNDDGGDAVQYELPSLEEVSKQFNDPTMQELFIRASNNEIPIVFQDPWNSVAVQAAKVVVPGAAGDAHAGFGIAPAAPSALRVTIRDALGVLGKTGFMELAVTVIDCYTAIGKFTEAKEFAFVVLTRCRRASAFRHLGVLERPLRWAVLRAALASKESEDAYRVGIRLLQEQCSEDERNRVLELLFGVLNRVEYGSAMLLRLVADRNQADPPMLVLLGNRYFLRRSYMHALNLYLAALQKRPNDILLCLLVGLSYLLISHQKKIRARETCVVAGWHYLSRYQEGLRIVDPRRQGEAVYNCARAFQYIGLHHLAVPLYEEVAYEYCVPEQCTLALQRAARLNLYFTYRWRTRNTALALAALQPRQ